MGLLSMGRRSTFFDPDAFIEDSGPSLVYMAVNRTNGKRYIGMTRQAVPRRWGQHVAQAFRGTSKYSILHKAIRKYGADAFEVTTLCECATYQDAALLEIRLIAEVKPEYNLGHGGESVPNVGFRFTEAAKEAARKANTGRPGYWTGKKRPDIAEIQRKRLTGRPDLIQHMLVKAHTREVWDKTSATKRLRGPSELHLAAMVRRRKRIVSLDNGRIFIGSQAVADAIGCKRDTVLRHLSGARKHVNGLRFAYVKDEE